MITTISIDSSFGVDYGTTISDSGIWQSVSRSTINTYLPNSDIITRKSLRNFCETKEITKDVFEELEERIPMGADLLKELIKIGNNDPYVKTLIRERKLKSL
ncbi:hypothetical protein M0Q50_05375 [bacterium]|jgi:hypothetical protein|nr:hypothetical protein [bacterium]